jgi:hypothetical protein
VPDLDYVVVAGYAQLPQSTGAGVMWRHLTIIGKIDSRSHRVLTASTTLATAVADEFVRENLIGLDLTTEAETFLTVVDRHYFGNGRKAIVGAFRDLVHRYEENVLSGA